MNNYKELEAGGSNEYGGEAHDSQVHSSSQLPYLSKRHVMEKTNAHVNDLFVLIMIIKAYESTIDPQRTSLGWKTKVNIPNFAVNLKFSSF